MSYAACRFPLAFVGLLASVSPVHGYEALSQDRRAQVEILRTTYGWLLPHLPGFDPPDSTTLEPFSASKVAPGFGPFDADVSVTGFPASFTMQSSELRPGKITASGSHNGFAETTQIEELPVSVTQVFVEPTTATSQL